MLIFQNGLSELSIHTQLIYNGRNIVLNNKYSSTGSMCLFTMIGKIKRIDNLCYLLPLNTIELLLYCIYILGYMGEFDLNPLPASFIFSIFLYFHSVFAWCCTTVPLSYGATTGSIRKKDIFVSTVIYSNV